MECTVICTPFPYVCVQMILLEAKIVGKVNYRKFTLGVKNCIKFTIEF
jgi:hypothetical protein